MTQFSSKPPFNDDPESYVSGIGNRHSENLNPAVWKHDPRPEFNRPQHNPTNRVLTHIRKNWDGHSEVTKGHLISIHRNLVKLAQESHSGEGWERYTEDTLLMMEHAIKVLSKWKAVFG